MIHGSIELRDWRLGDPEQLWDILQEWPAWWQGQARTRTKEEFSQWWADTITAAVIAEDSELGVVGVTYGDPVYRGQWATPHIFKRKGYRNPAFVRKVISESGKIKEWFNTYDLEKMWTWTASKSAVQLCLLMGFRVEGKARHYIKTDSGWLDAWQLSLLREEAWKKTPIGNMFRLLKWKWSQ